MSRETKVVYKNEWFEVEEERFDDLPELEKKPYYRIKTADAVVILATTKQNEVILIKQFRPTIRENTFELPAGGVHEGESFLEAAQRELREETGYVSDHWQEVGPGRILVNRFANRIRAFWAKDAEWKFQSENEIQVELVPAKDFKHWVLEGKFEQFCAMGAILLADWKWNLFK